MAGETSLKIATDQIRRAVAAKRDDIRADNRRIENVKRDKKAEMDRLDQEARDKAQQAASTDDDLERAAKINQARRKRAEKDGKHREIYKSGEEIKRAIAQKEQEIIDLETKAKEIEQIM